MSDFKEKLKTRTDSLKATVGNVMGNQPVMAPEAYKIPEEARYNDATRTREVRAQEEFRRKYKSQHNVALDSVEIDVQAPADYALEDVAVQERKYGYFSNTRKQRIRNARAQKAAWKESIDKYAANTSKNGYKFGVNDEMTEDTLDFMASTRRLAAIESKKNELAAQILTPEVLNALKEKDEHASAALDKYRGVILDLGPAIEVVPDDNEILTGDIRLNEESVERYKAYLRFVAADPIGAMEAAITDSLHQVTTFPEKMLGAGAIPQTFDRLMQIRNRYSAINRLRKLRQVAGSVKEDNPVAKLMTKLDPKEDQAADHDEEDDHQEEHEHDDKDNFEFIKLMEKAINSDVIRCLNKAGITYRAGFFGNLREKNYIESDGNAAKSAFALLKKNLSAGSEDEKAEKARLNAEYWEARKAAAYDELKKKKNEEDGPKQDVHDILKTIQKIKQESDKKKKIKYNTGLANELEKRIVDLSVTIDELQSRVDDTDAVLSLDRVRMSRELTQRMKADTDKAQYDLFHLLERAQGYINAYDHMLRGKALNVHGSAIIEGLKAEENEDGFVVIRDQVDTRYSTDTVDRMNRITDPVDPKLVEAKSDREAAEQVKEVLTGFETRSTELLRDIREISAAKKNAVIDKIIAFRNEYYGESNLLNHMTAGNITAITAMIRSIPDEKVRAKAMEAYHNTMTKCAFICTYADLYRLENIQNMYTDGKLPKELNLSEEEKTMKRPDFAERTRTLKKVLDNYQGSIAEYEKSLGLNAVKFNLADLNPDDEGEEEQAVNKLAELLGQADMTKLSDAEYAERPEEEVPVIQVVNRLDTLEKPLNEDGNGGGGDQPIGDQPQTKKVWKRIEKHSVIHTEHGDVSNTEILYEETEVPIDYEETEDEKEERERVEKELEDARLEAERQENERREKEEQERREQERLENERRERERRNLPYQKRITNPLVEDLLKEGSLKNAADALGYFAQQLGIVNKIGIVTWDELKAETKAWIVGRKIGKTTITKDNVDAFLDEQRDYILRERAENVVDATHYTDEDKDKYSDDNLEDKQFEAGSVGDLISKAINCDSAESAALYAVNEPAENAVDAQIQQEFKINYSGGFERQVAKENAKSAEADAAHIKWFLNHLPVQITAESFSNLRKEWGRKLRYDYLQGKVLSESAFKKIKHMFDSMTSAIDTVTEIPKVARIMENTRNVPLDQQIPDQKIANHNTDALNVHQWYGASCWATSGTVISKWYMKNVLKLENPPVIDQETFLHPDNIRLNPYAEKKMLAEMQGKQGNWGLAKEARDIQNFIRRQGVFGNLMTDADAMLANMSNTAVRHLRWNLPVGDKYIKPGDITNDDWNHFTVLFFKKVSDLLKDGSGPISLMMPGHYRTIIGVEGNVLKCRDSGQANGAVEKTFTIEQFTREFKSRYRPESGYSMELVFLQNINDQNKAALNEQFGVEYDGDGKLKYEAKDEEKDAGISENMIHNLGIAYQTKNNKEPENLFERFLKDELYVPKNLDHQKNVENVAREREELRKQLGLPEETKNQKEAREKNARQFEKEAANIRNFRAQEWEETAVPVPKTPEELEEERKQAEENARKAEEQRLKEAAEAKQRDLETRAKNAFGDKFDEQSKADLVKKTENFQMFLRGKDNLEAKEKDVPPTAMDVLNGDYALREKKLVDNDPDAGSEPLGFLLSVGDMEKIEAQLKKEGSAFANKAIENKESKVADVNAAIEAIKEGNISKFNHLPAFIKEFYGRKALKEFFGDDQKFKEGTLPTLKDLGEEGMKKLAGKTRDPLFRAAINMIITRKGKNAKGRDQSKTAMEYDKFLNQTLIMQTLAPMTTEAKERLRNDSARRTKRLMDGRQSADTMIANNMTKQRHLAKTMLLMQLGRFDKTETVLQGNKAVSQTGQYDSTVAEALAHGTRVGISLPPGTKAQQKALNDAWKGRAGELMSNRFATHDLHRRKVGVKGSRFEEVKLRGGFTGALKYIFTFGRMKKSKPASLGNNYGLDLSLGGLGRQFNKNQVIDDQGAFGHMYQKYVQGDENTCGGMLVGIENSAPGGTHFIQRRVGGYGGTSCIGEEHTSKGIAHNQSAFFSRRAFIGDQYGGRTVDLSHVDPDTLANILKSFDRKYSELQTEATKSISLSLSQEEIKEAEDKRADAAAKLEKINQVLSGRIMTAQRLCDLLYYLGIKEGGVGLKSIVASLRSTKDAQDKNKYSADMTKAKVKGRNLNAFFDDKNYVSANNGGDPDDEE